MNNKNRFSIRVTSEFDWWFIFSIDDNFSWKSLESWIKSTTFPELNYQDIKYFVENYQWSLSVYDSLKEFNNSKVIDLDWLDLEEDWDVFKRRKTLFVKSDRWRNIVDSNWEIVFKKLNKVVEDWEFIRFYFDRFDKMNFTQITWFWMVNVYTWEVVYLKRSLYKCDKEKIFFWIDDERNNRSKTKELKIFKFDKVSLKIEEFDYKLWIQDFSTLWWIWFKSLNNFEDIEKWEFSIRYLVLKPNWDPTGKYREFIFNVDKNSKVEVED